MMTSLLDLEDLWSGWKWSHSVRLYGNPRSMQKEISMLCVLNLTFRKYIQSSHGPAPGLITAHKLELKIPVKAYLNVQAIDPPLMSGVQVSLMHAKICHFTALPRRFPISKSLIAHFVLHPTISARYSSSRAWERSSEKDIRPRIPSPAEQN